MATNVVKGRFIYPLFVITATTKTLVGIYTRHQVAKHQAALHLGSSPDWQWVPHDANVHYGYWMQHSPDGDILRIERWLPSIFGGIHRDF